jgi:hypothetical protein
MIESFRIQNFRCFADLTVGPLGRVNLIAGKNNAGKTALLEALFVYTARAERPSRWLDLVARGPRARSSTTPSVENLVDGIKWLFRNRQHAAETSIALEGVPQGGKANRVSARLSPVQGFRPVPGPGDQGWQGGQVSQFLGEDTQQDDLLIEFQEGDQVLRAKIHLASGDLASHTELRGQGESLPCLFLPPGSKPNEKDLTRFSELKAEKRDRAIVEALRLFEPRLTDLQILVPPSQDASLHGDIGIGRMLPISLMGDGVQRLTSILMAAIAASGGLLLIDEIENGIHHSVQKDFFRVIAQSSRENKVQIFATTHSHECIEAAQTAFAGEHANDLRLHRLEVVKGDLKAITFDSEDLATAVDMKHEVR